MATASPLQPNDPNAAPELFPDVDHRERGQQIPDRLDRIAVDGGRTEHDGVGFLDQIDEGRHFAALQVVQRHPNVFHFLGPVSDGLGHQCGVAVSGDIENDHGLVPAGRLVCEQRGGELPVALYVTQRCVAQYGSVSGADQTDLQRLDQVQGIEHMLAERPHDVLVVVLEGKAEVADLVIEQARIAEVAAEHVARKQHGLFHQIAALGVGPVQERRVQKAQGAIAQADRIAGIYRGEDQVLAFQQTLQHHLGAHRDIQPGLRRAPHQLGQRSGVVRLQMVEHDGGDFRIVRDLFQASEKIIGMRLLHRIDHRHARAAPHAIGIVAGAVGGPENHVEVAQALVQGAHPVDARRKFNRTRIGAHETRSRQACSSGRFGQASRS